MLVQILILIETQKAWKPLHFIVNERKMGTDSLNVSANIDIDSDPKGFETQKPLLFGKNLDRHP